MNTEYHISRAFGPRVRHRYDQLITAGKPPSLRAIQSELNRLDALRLTEDEIAECLTPLDAGQRGHTSLSETASSSSRRAAHASAHAEEQDTPQAHFDARLAHSAAAATARSLAEYHDSQQTYHGEKASAKPGTETPPVESSRAMHPIQCARALPSLLGGATVPDVILYLPAGIHRITPSQGGKPVTVVVNIDEVSAERMEQQRRALMAGGGKPFFSVQHNTQIAAFWPNRFFWDTRRAPDGKMVTGVWSSGDWSQAGKEAVEGKNFRSFSPTFFVDKISNDEDAPAQVQSNVAAPLNMGALENDPAFGPAMSPLWHDNRPRV